MLSNKVIVYSINVSEFLSRILVIQPALQLTMNVYCASNTYNSHTSNTYNSHTSNTYNSHTSNTYNSHTSNTYNSHTSNTYFLHTIHILLKSS
jgi:hypothetical protein